MKYSIIYLLFAPIFSYGQNLVPNWSFENVECQTAFTFPWGCPITHNAPWQLPNTGSSDSFNTCHTGDFNSFNVPSNFQGNQMPANPDDQGYAGVITYEGVGTDNYREYLQVQLTEPLLAGETYIIGFKCSLGDNSQFAADGLGMHLSVNSVTMAGQTVISANPQLYASVDENSEGWSEYSQEFVAEGGENYLTIGNFFSDAETTIVPTGFGSFDRAFYYVDEVKVEAIANGLESNDYELVLLTLAPNPTEDILFITSKDAHENIVQLFDRTGKEVTDQVAFQVNSSHEITVNVNQLPNGLYLIKTNTGYGRIVKTADY